MDPEPEAVGSILLPEADSEGSSLRGMFRSDRGHCIAGHLKGKTVWVDWRVGKWIEDFAHGGCVIPGQTRFYGLASVDNTAQVQPLDECVWAIQEENAIRPYGRKVLILREPQRKEQNGILLTSEAATRTHKCTVLAVGGDNGGVQPGDEAVYQAGGLINIDFSGDPEVSQIMQEQFGLPPERIPDIALIDRVCLHLLANA